MDALIQFLVEELVEGLLFGVGRFVLRLISFGRIRLDAPTPFQVFLVAPIGLVTMILAVGGAASLVGFLS
ncbi:MAG TPA: hypothetical protein VFW68_05805 [Rhodocyclaceae bacterium]|nr:hypothetical protein [Rhodocyclaceae bacterium]